MTTKAHVALVVALIGLPAAVHAEWTANLGWASEYHYRGIFQQSSSANGGVDFNQGGFYAGTWAADVGDGLEVDGYFGYGGELDNFNYSIGYTGYFYTGDFDDTYQELNLGAGYGPLSVTTAIGEYENFDGPTEDYGYYALTLEHNGFYGTYAGFTDDFDGEYLELGYGTSIAEIDFGIVLILANDDLVGDDDESLIFTIGKTFGLQQ